MKIGFIGLGAMGRHMAASLQRAGLPGPAEVEAVSGKRRAPLALFRALRQGATGRKRTFERLAEHFLPGKYDPADFTVRLAHKDVTLALDMARQLAASGCPPSALPAFSTERC